MASRINTRRWVSFLYLLFLALIGGILYFQLQTTGGKIFLSTGVTEHTVITPHNPDHFSVGPHRNLSPDLLPLDNSRALRFLDPDETYDGAVMPLGLRLDRHELLHESEDEHELVIHGPDGPVVHPVVPGNTIPVGDSMLVVEELVPWEGLVRHERGRPLAYLAWATDASKPGTALFLEQDAWYYPDGQTALQFQWHETEAEAEQAARTGREALGAEARWGVRDGAAVQWLQSLTPGSGLTLRDGTQVRYVGREADGSAITLQVGGEKVTRVAVPRNAVGDPGPYYYQDPSGAPRVVRLHGWDEDRALVQCLEDSALPVTTALSAGGQWNFSHGGYLRLEQLMSRAVPLPHATGGLSALVLRHGDRTLQLREGIVHTSDTLRLEYRRHPQAPELSLHLAALNAAGEEVDTFTLPPGATHQLGNWEFTWEGQHVGSGEDVVLTARRRAGTWSVALGFALLFLGTLGLVYVQTRPRRT